MCCKSFFLLFQQDVGALWRYTSQFSKSQFLDAISDFHVLVFMAAMETVTLQVHIPVSLAHPLLLSYLQRKNLCQRTPPNIVFRLQDDDLDILVAAVMSQDAEIAETWAGNSHFWTTVKGLAGGQGR
jgi:hypothetical protein